MQVAGDPALSGAKSVMSVLSAILAVGTSNVPASVLAACKDTLAYATEDAKGAIALVTNGTGSSTPAVPPVSTTPTARPAPPQPACCSCAISATRGVSSSQFSTSSRRGIH